MKLRATNHAVERYQERVKPAIGSDAARQELEALLQASPPPIPDPPRGVSATDPDTEAFVVLSDGIVGCIRDGAVTTILIRGTDHPDIRARRNEKKKRRRALRKYRNALTGPPKDMRRSA